MDNRLYFVVYGLRYGLLAVLKGNSWVQAGVADGLKNGSKTYLYRLF